MLLIFFLCVVSIFLFLFFNICMDLSLYSWVHIKYQLCFICVTGGVPAKRLTQA